MEFFLWFWLLDRRFFCEMRPLLKQFAFLWIFPIVIHALMVSYNIFCVFPFKNLVKSQYIIILITVFELISIICILFMMINLYNIAKKQPKKDKKNIFVLFYEKIKSKIKREKDNFIYYEDYWIARKNLMSPNGISILILSIIHIIWSFFYLSNQTLFQDILKFGEKFHMSYCYLNIIFGAPVVLLLLYASIIKITFVLSAICCVKCVYRMSETCCCKRNKRLNRTINFSDVEILEPEYN